MEETREKIEIEFLGTGTSTGVPFIGCECPVCTSSDVKDKRLRSSVIVRTQGKNLLIDCGPDFRTQMLRASNQDLDALLVTHIHYDHVGGIDDLRPYCYRPEKFPIYARAEVLRNLREKMPYSFSKNPYPGAPVFRTYEVGEQTFLCEGVSVTPLPVWHGKLLMTGYRIGDVAYITDAKVIDKSTMGLLKGVRLLIINGLRYEEHATHFTVQEALEVIKIVQPERAYLTHMCHRIGLHDEAEKMLPEGVKLAYDGLVVRLD